MFFQSSVDCDVYGSNNPAAGSELVGSVVAGVASALETGYGYISLVSATAGDCSISYVSAGAASSGGGGGGGGAVTIADGADVTQGARAQTVATDDTGTWSLVQLTKRGLQRASSASDSLTALLTQATNFRPALGSTQSMSVTAISSAAQAVTAGDVIRYSNAGTKPIAIMFGGSGVTAGYATALDIMPGSSEAITVPATATHFAAICNTGDSGTLKWTRGTGL
jgi:hypothetical protein